MLGVCNTFIDVLVLSWKWNCRSPIALIGIFLFWASTTFMSGLDDAECMWWADLIRVRDAPESRRRCPGSSSSEWLVWFTVDSVSFWPKMKVVLIVQLNRFSSWFTDGIVVRAGRVIRCGYIVSPGCFRFRIICFLRIPSYNFGFGCIRIAARIILLITRISPVIRFAVSRSLLFFINSMDI